VVSETRDYSEGTLSRPSFSFLKRFLVAVGRKEEWGQGFTVVVMTKAPPEFREGGFGAAPFAEK
jgi:hypothetical protein